MRAPKSPVPLLRLAPLLGGVLLAGCGGGGSEQPVTPTAPPQATPSPVVSRPTPAPEPDPRDGLPPGPIVKYTVKVRTVNNGAREVVQDGEGRWLVNVGERVDFDSTQKNASGEICKWVNDPVWYLDGRDVPFFASNGLVYRRGSSQPFLLKLTIETPGVFTVQAEIDGVRSNTLEMKSK